MVRGLCGPGIVTLVGLLSTAGCSSSAPSKPAPMSAATSIRLSQVEAIPTTVGAPEEILVTFDEPLDGTTVAGNVRLLAARPGGQWVADPPIDVAWSATRPTEVRVRSRSGSRLPQGEEFHLVVGTGIRSATGQALPEDLSGYFATDYDLVLGADGVPALGGERKAIFTISDIHLGDSRAVALGYGWTVKNRADLATFLGLVRQSPNVKELVIAGDLLDEWVAPMQVRPFPAGTDEAGFVDDVARTNGDVFGALRALIGGGAVRVTYVPGNHDMLARSADISRILPGIFQARDAQGLGAYVPADHPQYVFEHGHRYDFFSSPDPISNRNITRTDSILPPGFFVSKIASSHDAETNRAPGALLSGTQDAGLAEYGLYWVAWQAILLDRPVTEKHDVPVIETGIDGYEKTYAIDDLVPQLTLGGLDVVLYQGIESSWYDRQEANRVQVPVPKEMATAAAALGPLIDAEAGIQYFWNVASDKRVVVFGHTHESRVVPSFNLRLQGTVYANSGTWVDRWSGYPTMTFVVIFPPREGRVLTSVATYRYRPGLPPEKLDSAAFPE